MSTLNHSTTASAATLEDERFEQLRQWAKALLFVCLLIGLLFFISHAIANDGVEFAEASTKFEGWVKGNLGKVAALICVALGALAAAVRKDYQWLLGGVALGMLVGIIVGIINSSFTATI
ncbi:conjugal transfer protein TrbC (plasmid) [Burkholderia ubonensis]|uniref:Conjugal transfer protein TrbC n=1 Tax=Burkholderia ubonensis TaxID=101571 RepID=A0A105GJ57_9BURK|nr:MULTISPECIES: hypothetical protein [Burkholderia]AOJ64710.1 conjugal transfer protein TrbC [Burkholderia ubonensis]KIP17112.1 putative membrane protein [Burkholderia sp. MSHR3999]KVG61646.1 conjugal transfer protein TrbC [Burkholderia ubonensis]KVR29893.1 conjugal transfer protein TrbC [Burkholderia ubonensis]